MQRDQEDGSVFIEGDGGRFGMILDFLRGSASSENVAERIGRMEEMKRQAMVEDLDYYGVEEAVLGPRVPCLIEDADFRPGPQMTTGRYHFGAAVSG